MRKRRGLTIDPWIVMQAGDKCFDEINLLVDAQNNGLRTKRHRNYLCEECHMVESGHPRAMSVAELREKRPFAPTPEESCSGCPFSALN